METKHKQEIAAETDGNQKHPFGQRQDEGKMDRVLQRPTCIQGTKKMLTALRERTSAAEDDDPSSSLKKCKGRCCT